MNAALALLAGLGGQQIGARYLTPAPAPATAQTDPHSPSNTPQWFGPIQSGKPFFAAEPQAPQTGEKKLTQTFWPEAYSAKSLAERTTLEKKLRSGELTQAASRDELYQALAQYTLPSVVLVSYEMPNPDFDPNLRLPPFIPQPPRVFTGTGSGFFIQGDGTFITNYHVVESPVEQKALPTVSIQLLDGRTTTAKLVNHNKEKDLAVYKLEGDWKDLPTLSFSESPIRAGQEVMAAGHPMRHGWSTNFGKVSHAERKLFTGQTYIQTDTDFNQGLSGGPLVNNRGEVVGINNLMIGSEYGSELGCAIPAATIRQVLPDLLKPAP
jgi:S1-C subfamily serine protease